MASKATTMPLSVQSDSTPNVLNDPKPPLTSGDKQISHDLISEFDPLAGQSKDVHVPSRVMSPDSMISTTPLPPTTVTLESTKTAPPDRTTPQENTPPPPPTTLQSLARKQSTETQDGPPPLPFDFQTFLDQMKSKSAEPVAKYLRSFLTNFSRKTFSVNDQIKLIQDFLDFIAVRMRECDVWKNSSDQEFENALEAMEKLVMNRLYDYTFTPQIDQSTRKVTTDDLERDHVLRQRIRLFDWVREEHLDIPIGEGSQGFTKFAEQELLKINHYKAPRDKLICILNSCKVIFGLIRHLQREEGADSFIPILIFVVLQANPEHLLSNVEYINRFRRPEKLQSEAGYYLSSLMGAISFVETMDHSSLSNITQEEFERNVEKSIQNLPSSPVPTSPILGNKTVTSVESSHAGEESARPLQLSNINGTSLAEDTRRFLQRTSETISKPMNLIGKIFTDALDGLDESPPRRATPPPRAAGDSSPSWLTTPTPYQPRVRRASSTASTPGRQTPDPQYAHPRPHPLGYPPIDSSSRPPSHNDPVGRLRSQTPDTRTGSPMDIAAMQAEIDRAHVAANDAARETLTQIFPGVDPEVADMVLEANQGDLGLSIDKLLEMGVGNQ